MTLYDAFALFVFPALSVAVQLTDFVPTEFVTSAPQPCEARPESASASPELTVAVPLRITGLGLTAGVKVGAVLSIFTVTTLLRSLVLPAASVTVCAEEATAAPSALSVWSAGHAKGNAGAACIRADEVYRYIAVVPVVRIGRSCCRGTDCGRCLVDVDPTERRSGAVIAVAQKLFMG
jgi:hypothetical protein